MITASSITDAQIRTLKAQLERDCLTAGFALLREPFTASLRAQVRAARARCAELLNRRAGAK